MSVYDIVIVGAGHGGAQAAIALRQAGVTGSIAMIGDEADPPYERPPLSKDYVTGQRTFERLLIRPMSFWADRGIELLLGRRVDTVDAAAHTVVSADGTRIGYRHLIWATGGTPRRLTCSGYHLAGVHTLRSRADADRLAAELPQVRRAVVVGGGYIGLEAAAMLTKAGKHVTVLEAGDRVLARVAGEPLSRFFEAEHRAHGVDLRLGVQVDCILGTGAVRAVRLADGTELEADLVVVGIGIEPATAPLTAAGAVGTNGVDVDGQCRTSLSDIFAIGDCARHANRYADGARIRLESVQNANDQAAVVARTIAGQDVDYQAVPWFWSVQYDLKLQTVGLSGGHDAIIVRGNPGDRSFSLVYLRDDVVIALDCVNAVKDYVKGRKLVEGGARSADVLDASPRDVAVRT